MPLKDAILSANDRGLVKQETPEWGHDVYLRVLSATERDAWERATFTGPEGKANRDDLLARLLVRTLCDENGARIFEDSDAPALSAKSSVVLLRLYAAASKLNALSKEDVENLAKKSSSVPADSSQ